MTFSIGYGIVLFLNRVFGRFLGRNGGGSRRIQEIDRTIAIESFDVQLFEAGISIPEMPLVSYQNPIHICYLLCCVYINYILLRKRLSPYQVREEVNFVQMYVFS